MSENRSKVCDRKNLLLLMGIFAFALLVRIFWAVNAESIDPFLKSNPLLGDAASYYRIAMNLLAANGYSLSPQEPSSFWPPLYPFSLYMIFAFFNQDLTTARIFQAVWGVVPPVVFSWVGLKYFGRTEASLAGFGLAIYPHLIYFGAWLIAEALFMMLFSIVLLTAAIFAWKKHDYWLIIMGIFLGLAILTKPSALFFAPFLAFWAILAPKEISTRKRFGYALLLTLPTLAIVLPWSFRNYLVFDRFVLVSSNGGYTLLGANNPNAWGGHDEHFPPLIPGLSDAEMEEIFTYQAMQWIRSNPRDFFGLAIIKIQRLLSPLSVASQPQDYSIPGASIIYLIYWLFLLLAFIGMIVGLTNVRTIGYLYAPIIGVLLSTIIYYGDARYTIPMAPSLVLFASLSLVSGLNWIKNCLFLKTHLVS